MFIPGEIISLLTFPGVIVHELAHKIFCELAGIQVYEVCYFRLGNPAGYVKHEPVRGYNQAFLVSVAPFLLNSVLAFVIFLFAVHISESYFQYFLYWLGISIAMNSFPSNEDANNLWNYSKRAWKVTPLALLGFPVVVLIKIANVLSIIWFDLFYAIGLLIIAGGTI